MCVGLSAKVVRISDGTAVVDAGGAKREVSSELLEDLEPGDYVMVHAESQLQRSQKKMTKRPISLWKNCYRAVNNGVKRINDDAGYNKKSNI